MLKNPLFYTFVVPLLLFAHFCIKPAYDAGNTWLTIGLIVADIVLSALVTLVCFILYMIYGGHSEDEHDPY